MNDLGSAFHNPLTSKNYSLFYPARYYFKRYGGLNFLLRFDYDNHFIKQIDLPLFYKEMLFHMMELKQLYGYYQEQDLEKFC